MLAQQFRNASLPITLILLVIGFALVMSGYQPLGIVGSGILVVSIFIPFLSLGINPRPRSSRESPESSPVTEQGSASITETRSTLIRVDIPRESLAAIAEEMVAQAGRRDTEDSEQPSNEDVLRAEDCSAETGDPVAEQTIDAFGHALRTEIVEKMQEKQDLKVVQIRIAEVISGVNVADMSAPPQGEYVGLIDMEDDRGRSASLTVPFFVDPHTGQPMIGFDPESDSDARGAGWSTPLPDREALMGYGDTTTDQRDDGRKPNKQDTEWKSSTGKVTDQ